MDLIYLGRSLCLNLICKYFKHKISNNQKNNQLFEIKEVIELLQEIKLKGKGGKSKIGNLLMRMTF